MENFSWQEFVNFTHTITEKNEKPNNGATIKANYKKCIFV